MRLENIMSSMGKKDVPTVNVVLKTDVRGTLANNTASEDSARITSDSVIAPTPELITRTFTSSVVLVNEVTKMVLIFVTTASSMN
jgi:translation initiation factor IF-2